MQNLSKSFRGLVLLAAMFLLFAGCSDNERGDKSKGNIVNAANEAWTDAHLYPAGDRNGYIVKKNGDFQMINDYSDKWRVSDQGSWSKSGNKLTISIPDFGVITGTYKLSGDTLTFTSPEWYLNNVELVRTANVIIGESSGEKYTPIPQELVGEWHAMSADGLISYGGEVFTADGKMYSFSRDGSNGDVYDVKMLGTKIMYYNIIVEGWYDAGLTFEDGILWHGNSKLVKK